MILRAGRALALALLTCGCSTNYDNPFVRLPGTQPPPLDADLLVASAGPGLATADVRDVYAVDVETGATTRLTSCGLVVPRCDVMEVSPGPDHGRVIVRRRVDTNDDDRLTELDEIQVFSIDLVRAIEGRILADLQGITGIHWSDFETAPLFLSASGAEGLDDIYDALVDGTASENLTSSPTFWERQPRLEGVLLVYERFADKTRSEVWAASPGFADAMISGGDTTVEPLPLPGTPYLMGSDADPDPSPDLTSIAFRRLTGLGDGRGTWEILTIGLDSENLTPIASGAAFRTAADWGEQGIVFVEEAPDGNTANLVLQSPDGATRRVLLTARAGTLLSPRWLP